MLWDERAIMENEVASLTWLRLFSQCRGERLTSWVSKFHTDKLPCKLASNSLSDDFHGTFNWACLVVFDNGEKWVVRFPIPGRVMNPDEKVEIEAATICFIRQQTDIPIPEIKAWGLSKDNELGLGPFTMSSYVPGINLFDIFKDSTKPDYNLIRQDISDRDLDAVFRQIAKIMLDLSKLDFPRIGSLSWSPGNDTVNLQPMTWKGNMIRRYTGANVFGPKTSTFSSTTDYFSHVVGQDFQCLREQPNVFGAENEAKYGYKHWKVLEALIPRVVWSKYDKGPFKLICDDFRLANIIVNNAKDLKIVAVVDWEWSYAGPCQLFWSPPRWLTGEAPVNWCGDEDEIRRRHEKLLEVFLQILKEEELESLGDEIPMEERPSTLMSQCKMGGIMWFHYLMWEGPFRGYNVNWKLLRAGSTHFRELWAAAPEEEANDFAKTKMRELAEYELFVAEKRKWYDRQRQGDDQWDKWAELCK